jgi:mono/diheme cytochrome c family protein
VLCALLSAGCDDDTTPADSGMADLAMKLDGGAPDLTASGPNAARGEYLVKHLLICGDCHTTPDPTTGQPSQDPTKFLAGGRLFAFPAPIDGGMGMVYAKNLTPDNATGIGMWSESQIVDALTVGVDDQGMPLFPIMPYYMFGNLTMDDAMSIAKYLKTLPAATNAVPEDNIAVPQAAPRIDDTKVPHTTLASTDQSFGAAERGRYLVEVSCIECHTKHTPPGSPQVIDFTKVFAGGETFPLAPGLTTISGNITPDNTTGIGSWSTTDIVSTLKTNHEKGVGRMLCPPMPAGMMRLGGLTDGDLSDIANYVHTVPAITNGPFGCTDAGVPYGIPDGG